MNIAPEGLLTFIYLFGLVCFIVGYGLVYALHPELSMFRLYRNGVVKSSWELEQEIWKQLREERRKKEEEGMI